MHDNHEERIHGMVAASTRDGATPRGTRGRYLTMPRPVRREGHVNGVGGMFKKLAGMDALRVSIH